tara:strand:+ start:6368 stop:6580 length:213 start_codon:yes stop_codon:yes gene_type:complete
MKIHSFSTVKAYQEKIVNRLEKYSNDISYNKINQSECLSRSLLASAINHKVPYIILGIRAYSDKKCPAVN